MSRILLCDDARFMRHVLAGILTKAGNTIVGEAGNGVEAIDMYKSLRPDVVFMDITMPEMDGVSAVRGIMAEDSNAKIIMCSAMGQRDMVVDALKSGAKDFIVKPFEPDRVFEALSKI